jgi:REP-associated tyrosine transposase
MKYNSDIHRRRSMRLMGYDYSQAGAYFVTICTQNRQCLFGDIGDDGEMLLNDAGQMVHRIWNDSPVKYSGIEIDEFVLMPNHFHGIIVIVGTQFIAPCDCDTTNRNKNRGVMNHAPTENNATNNGQMKQGAIMSVPAIGEIVRAFKAHCTYAINQIRNTTGHPVWQRNYYEHIIRNDQSLQKIRQYITNNPAKWADDENNPANVPGRIHDVRATLCGCPPAFRR